VLKLGDFGIAYALDKENLTINKKCGTPYYMAPEVCDG